MVIKCCICKRKFVKKGTMRFYSFPNPETRKLNVKWREQRSRQLERWRSVLNNRSSLINIKNLRVCSIHFVSGSPAEFNDENNVDWFPSQHLGKTLFEADNSNSNDNVNKSAVAGHINEDETTGESSDPQDHIQSILSPSTSNSAVTSHINEDAVVQETTGESCNSHDCIQPILSPSTSESTVAGRMNEDAVVHETLGDSSNPHDSIQLILSPSTTNTDLSFNYNDFEITDSFSTNLSCSRNEDQLLLEENLITTINEVHTQKDAEIKRLREELKLKSQELAIKDQELATKDELIGIINRNLETERINRISAFNDMQARLNEIHSIREELKKWKIQRNYFAGNDKKILYYTGLHNLKMFEVILEQMNPALDDIRIKNQKLDNFQKLLLTLMKMRLNCTFTSLAYRFNISVKQASYVFKQVVIMFDVIFRGLVFWPSREVLSKAVPRCFREKFGNKVTVIIDCFEVKTQRPSSLLGKSQVFSSYKHDHTIKYLLGITPQGTVAFISKAYGGRVTDACITQSCGIGENLMKGDLLLADRGFTIEEWVGSLEASVLTPSFKKWDQFLQSKLKNNQDVSSVRVHVERMIGMIRGKYKIMQGPLPISILKCKTSEGPLMDSIIRSACAIVNMCQPIIPL